MWGGSEGKHCLIRMSLLGKREEQVSGEARARTARGSASSLCCPYFRLPRLQVPQRLRATFAFRRGLCPLPLLFFPFHSRLVESCSGHLPPVPSQPSQISRGYVASVTALRLSSTMYSGTEDDEDNKTTDLWQL